MNIRIENEERTNLIKLIKKVIRELKAHKEPISYINKDDHMHACLFIVYAEYRRKYNKALFTSNFIFDETNGNIQYHFSSKKLLEEKWPKIVINVSDEELMFIADIIKSAFSTSPDYLSRFIKSLFVDYQIKQMNNYNYKGIKKDSKKIDENTIQQIYHYATVHICENEQYSNDFIKPKLMIIMDVFKDINNLNSIKQPLVSIHKKFDAEWKKAEMKIDEFRKKIFFPPEDNKSLFYGGIEYKARNLCDNTYRDKIRGWLFHFVNQMNLKDQYFYKKFYIKIQIESDGDNKNNAKRLLCVLIELMFLNQSNKELEYIYLLFPLEYANFHDKK